MRHSVPLFAAVVLLIGCGGTAPALRSAGAGSPNALARFLDRPVSPRHLDAVSDSTRSTTGAPGPRYWTQFTDYTLRARLFPDEKRLQGTGQIVYHNRSPHHLFSIHLELSLNLHAPGVVRNEAVEVGRAMRLTRVAIDGVELTKDATTGPRYAVNGTSLVVIPGRPIASGSETTLGLEWSVDLPAHGAGGRMGHDRDELFFLAYWYPTVSVYDDVDGWFTDPFRGSAEFYHGFGNYDVTIEAPQEWVVHATGSLLNGEEILSPEIVQRLRRAGESDQPVRILDEDAFDGGATLADSGETVAWRFRAEQVPDFSFSATRHSLWDAARAPVGDVNGDGATDYTLMHAVYRTNAPLWQQVVGFGQHALRFLSDYTGLPYPWPHMTAVEGTPIETGG
ncbi:MAG TPA: M1 family peptidase, partial [Rhodothermales bacterium]